MFRRAAVVARPGSDTSVCDRESPESLEPWESNQYVPNRVYSPQMDELGASTSSVTDECACSTLSLSELVFSGSILTKIIGFLSFNDMIECRQVNRTWAHEGARLVHAIRLAAWQNIDPESFLVRGFATFPNVVHLEITDAFESADHLCHFFSSRIDLNQCRHRIQSLPNLVILDDGSIQTVAKMCAHFPQLRLFHISFGKVQRLPELWYECLPTNLTELILTDAPSVRASDCWTMAANFPSLEQLTVFNTDIEQPLVGEEACRFLEAFPNLECYCIQYDATTITALAEINLQNAPKRRERYLKLVIDNDNVDALISGLQLIARYFPKLLTLSHATSIFSGPNTQPLDLSSVGCTPEQSRNLLQAATHVGHVCKLLRELDLGDSIWPWVTIEALSLSGQIRHVQLSSATGGEQDVERSTQLWPHLESLNIGMDFWFSNDEIQSLARNCHNLVRLNVSVIDCIRPSTWEKLLYERPSSFQLILGNVSPASTFNIDPKFARDLLWRAKSDERIHLEKYLEKELLRDAGGYF